mgnify:CR=1 FL=1
MKKQNVPEIFGSLVFDDRIMRSRLSASVYDSLRKTIDENEKLEKALEELKGYDDIIKTSEAIRDDVLPKMEHLRKHVDEAEMLTSEEFWPFPSYGKLLFSVN